MKKVRFIGIIQNQNGDTVDILSQGIESELPIFMNSDIDGYDLAPDETGFFVTKSHSKSGRCIGPADPEGYTLHYWLNFEAEDGQNMTEYYTTTLSGQEK